MAVLVAAMVTLGARVTDLATPAELTAVTDPSIQESPLRIPYGDTSDTFGDLYLPSTSSTRLPVVVLIHGGGWTQSRTLAQFDAHARGLAAEGIAVWNIEYRRVHGQGGWPTTLTDVADAIDALSVVAPLVGNLLDLQRVHVAGHSAGGQLAAWAAGHRPPPDHHQHSGVRIRSLTLMAAVLDLDYAVTNGRDRFVTDLLGGRPDQVPERYHYASPIHHLPVETEITALHGDQDRVVAPAQSRRYVEAVHAAGAPAELRILPGTGHGEFADARSAAWQAARGTILDHVHSIN
ncbi:alpha/beta hydrolase family protein [Nocardia mangyaensis]|nr:alpha/beta fold hydrolase [Nocardia mangyaensis]